MNWNWLKSLRFWDFALLAVVALFVLNKIQFLDYPYFWDEAWVYAPAVFDMYDNGPSLLPNSINPDLSRGHPILFHFLAVCWMMIFGTGFTAVHLFPLAVSVVLMFAVYKLGSWLGDKPVGFWAAALLALQPLFIQQSGLLLPEVLLALFATLTILFYLKRKVWLFIISATALLLTKETGILVVAVIGLLELVEFIRERSFTKNRVWEFVSLGVPVGFAALYFVVQYFQFGWYIFPEHVSMFETDPNIWEGKRTLVFSSLFLEQQRPILVSVALAVGAFGWHKAPGLLRVLFLFCSLTFATMAGLSSWLPDWYFYYAFPLIIAITLIWTGVFLAKTGTKNHLFLPYVGIICTVMILFTSSHFVIGRYLLYLYPLVIISMVLICYLSLKQSKGFFNILMLSVGLMFYYLTNTASYKMATADDMKYIRQIEVLQDGIGYLRQEGLFSECIAGSFLVQQALSYPVQGYVEQGNKPNCVQNHIPVTTDYVLLINYEPDAGLEWIKTDSGFEEVFFSNSGKAMSWVFKRKAP